MKMLKTIELLTGKDRALWCNRSIELDKHRSYKVKNVYFQERRMEEWTTKEQEIIERYNLLLQESNEKERQRIAEKKRTLEIIEEKEREEKERKRLARAATRAANKAKKEAEPLVVPRRSSRKRTPKKLD